MEVFDGKGKYQAPMFSWFRSIRPIGMAFFNSDKMGNHYKNDLFIGDIINGNIYHFDLNLQRTELLFPPGKLWDGVANSSDALDDVIFGKGFGGISDIKVGLDDGYLYVLRFSKSKGAIYRIVPVSTKWKRTYGFPEV